jgi:hypothetical protein
VPKGLVATILISSATGYRYVVEQFRLLVLVSLNDLA